MLIKVFGLAVLVSVALGAVVPAFEQDPEWEGRIIGGQVAGTNQFPFQCSLRTTGNAHYCGCSIVNNRCTVGRTLANTRVIVGAHSRTTGGLAHNSARVVNHPNYDTRTIANDVCVIQTATALLHLMMPSSQSPCQSRHGAGTAGFILASSLCAGGVNGQGVCMNDSGGPLVSGGTQIGIVSWGIGCGVGFPDTYARVSSFRS